MAKLGWKMLTAPDKLWVRLFNEKYLCRSTFFNCIPEAHQSPILRDILKGCSLLEDGLIVGIGNGKSTSLW